MEKLIVGIGFVLFGTVLIIVSHKFKISGLEIAGFFCFGFGLGKVSGAV
jgi:hypothetical protein